MKTIRSIWVMAALATAPAWAGVTVQPEQITITATGMDHDDQFCQGFKLTKIQVAKYLRQAKKISNEELHYEYDWLGCYVRGSYVSKIGVSKWEIRAGGTGTIWEPNGHVIKLGCKS